MSEYLSASHGSKLWTLAAMLAYWISWSFFKSVGYLKSSLIAVSDTFVIHSAIATNATMLTSLTSALIWYQKKIGAYDKQSWEKTVDLRILRGVSAVPKKLTRVKTELIDVDLVRGSAFPKAKPQHSWIAATISGVTRVLFLPFYFTWWQLQTNSLVSSFLVILYFLQIFAIYIFYSSDEADFSCYDPCVSQMYLDSCMRTTQGPQHPVFSISAPSTACAVRCHYMPTSTSLKDIPLSEVLTPVAMMLILGILHSQIVATFSSKSTHKRVTRTKRKRMKRKRVKSFEISDTKSSPETASDDKNHIEASPLLLDADVNYNNHCTPEQNGAVGSSEQIASKKASDDESGLDIADMALSKESQSKSAFNPSVPNKCPHDSHCIVGNSKNTCCHHSHISTCSPDSHHSHTATCSPDSHHSNITKYSPDKLPKKENCAAPVLTSETHVYCFGENVDPSYASSGEEYFVAKKPSYSNEQWKNYLLQMKSHVNNRKFWCQTKDCIKRCHNQTHRRFSDCGPVHISCIKNGQHDEVCNSEDGYRSFIDACNVCSEIEKMHTNLQKSKLYQSGIRLRRPVPPGLHVDVQRCVSSGESGPDTTSPNTPHKPQTSDLEWPLITNTDCNSDSSDCPSQSTREESDTSPSENPFAWEMQESAATSFSALGPNSDKGPQTRTVSCTIWEQNECKKVDLSVLDISSAIIRKVDSSIPSAEYLAMGLLFASAISVLPLLFRLQTGTTIDTIQDVTLDVINFTVPSTQDLIHIVQDMMEVMLGSNWRSKTVVFIFMLERFTLSLTYFFLLSVAEKTFKQRFLYAKNFCYLTSSRRARRTDLPHFRLNKVRNIKTWLSVRSYLKKLGPQRSVDVIVSIAFILEVCVLSFLCVQLLKETGQFASKLHCWETLVWTLALGFFLLRFMIIGSKINKKYRNLSVLITEQINLYLHMEQKPHKKNELMLANSVLKLAADLLKELESPFKISGLSANPFLYNFTKVVVLSAFSAVLTEVLGFKLKLYKMKIK